MNTLTLKFICFEVKCSVAQSQEVRADSLTEAQTFQCFDVCYVIQQTKVKLSHS